MEKHLALVKDGQLIDVVVRPGTTAQDICRELGFPPEFVLSGRDGRTFGGHEEVYPAVETGAKLFVSPLAVVGSSAGLARGARA
jgi:hypothetical protein